MDGARELLELTYEYQQARERREMSPNIPGEDRFPFVGRDPEQIAADYEAALRRLLAP